MSDLSFHLSKIKDSADSINSQYFRAPGIFSNAVIYRPDITTLIQDADPEDQALFSMDNSMGIKKTTQSIIQNIEEYKEWNFETLCEALRKISKVYNIYGLEDKLKFYESKWARLSDNIVKYEDIVEQGRRRLASFAVETRGYALGLGFDKDKESAERVDALIKQHEEEIARLEVDLDIRNKEVEILRGRKPDAS